MDLVPQSIYATVLTTDVLDSTLDRFRTFERTHVRFADETKFWHVYNSIAAIRSYGMGELDRVEPPGFRIKLLERWYISFGPGDFELWIELN